MDSKNIVTINIEEMLTLDEAYERFVNLFNVPIKQMKVILYELEHTKRAMPTHISFSNIDQGSEASIYAVKIKAYKERKKTKYNFFLDYVKKRQKMKHLFSILLIKEGAFFTISILPKEK